jgi:hypothetical protein
VTWRKLKFISVVATALALIATLAVARAVRSAGSLQENRNQTAPLYLRNNFACPPLVSAWDCEIIINTFPMSTGQSPRRHNAADKDLSFLIAKSAELAINLIANPSRIRP